MTTLEELLALIPDYGTLIIEKYDSEHEWGIGMIADGGNCPAGGLDGYKSIVSYINSVSIESCLQAAINILIAEKQESSTPKIVTDEDGVRWECKRLED